MKFEYFRFSLVDNNQRPLPFKKDLPSREEVARKIFDEGEKYKFEIQGVQHAFIVKYKKGNLIKANVGKQGVAHLRGDPNSGFAEKDAENWGVCTIYLRLSSGKQDDQNNQIIAFQSGGAIANSFNCLNHLAEEINKKIIASGHSLCIEIIPPEGKRLLNVLRDHKGKIKRLTMMYVPPNVLNLRGALTDQLTEIKKKNKATGITFSIENANGSLDLPEDDFLKQSADCIDGGAGRYKVVLVGKKPKTIDSESSIRSKTFKDLPENEAECIEMVINDRDEKPRPKK